jgi:hypothetical protein
MAFPSRLRRAAICIGVNQTGGMKTLVSAADSAREFKQWAKGQGCDTSLLVDSEKEPVLLAEIFAAVAACLDPPRYDVLMVYFAGHGILRTTAAEFWLLSKSPENGNEAVNLVGSVEKARESGVPHVIFISDACRSLPKRPISEIDGGVIFPIRDTHEESEIDVYYATKPGKPALEIPHEEAVKKYRPIFTKRILETVKNPERRLVDRIFEGTSPQYVIGSRKLKYYLERVVPEDAADFNIKAVQKPIVRVGTALPKFFAYVQNFDPQLIRPPGTPSPGPVSPIPGGDDADIRGRDSSAIGEADDAEEAGAAGELSSLPQFAEDIARIVKAQDATDLGMRTGFSIFGARPVAVEAGGWKVSLSNSTKPDAWHIRLDPSEESKNARATALIQFKSGMGTVLPIMPASVGTIIVDNDQVVGVTYAPSKENPRYEWNRLLAVHAPETKALVNVAASHGVFLPGEWGLHNYSRVHRRLGRPAMVEAGSIDPILALFSAYAYAEKGLRKEVYEIYRAIQQAGQPVPFDIAMLASRHSRDTIDFSYCSIVPMLSIGWFLMDEDDPFFASIHKQVRKDVIPSLWVTVTAAGVAKLSQALKRQGTQREVVRGPYATA